MSGVVEWSWKVELGIERISANRELNLPTADSHSVIAALSH